MRGAPPQSLMGWQEVQCLAELADVILGPLGTGLVEEPVPIHTHGEGPRGHPGRRGDGLGLVGTAGRSPAQAVGGGATAVARAGRAGTAVEQACKKGETAGEVQATVGPCVRRVGSHRKSWVPPSRFLCQSRCVLGRPWLPFVSS